MRYVTHIPLSVGWRKISMNVQLRDRYLKDRPNTAYLQYIPRNMHTVFALLCFAVVIHRLIFPYPSGLLHWHYGNLTIAPVPAKQPRWIWINTSCEFIMNDCITTTKQSTTKPCAYSMGYTVSHKAHVQRLALAILLGKTSPHETHVSLFRRLTDKNTSQVSIRMVIFYDMQCLMQLKKWHLRFYRTSNFLCHKSGL